MKSVLLFFAFCILYKFSDCNINAEESRQWSHYPVQTQQASASDSYVKAAEHSASIKGAEQQIAVASDSSHYNYYPSGDSSAYYYHVHPNSKPKYYGYGNSVTSKQSFGGNIVDPVENSLDGGFYERPDEPVSKTDPVSIAGLGSLVISSLSGLSWVAIAALALILGPVLVPLVLAPLIMLAIIIYFIPVVKLDLPAENNGRSSASNRAINVLKHLEGTARFVQQVAENEECIERISCEIARMTKGHFFENWINKKLESYRNKWVNRVSRSFKAAINGSDCRIYSCDPNAQLKKVAQKLGART